MDIVSRTFLVVVEMNIKVEDSPNRPAGHNESVTHCRTITAIWDNHRC